MYQCISYIFSECTAGFIRTVSSDENYRSGCTSAQNLSEATLDQCKEAACQNKATVFGYRSSTMSCELLSCDSTERDNLELQPDNNGWDIYTLHLQKESPQNVNGGQVESFPIWAIGVICGCGVLCIGAVVAVSIVCSRKKNNNKPSLRVNQAQASTVGTRTGAQELNIVTMHDNDAYGRDHYDRIQDDLMD